MNHVITLSRELGSGGNQVAQELSKRLDIPYYDNEIISKPPSIRACRKSI